MNRRAVSLFAGVGVAVAALSWGRAVALADASASASAPHDSSPVVARVGTREITANELSRRLAFVPPFQLKTFGKTPDEIRRNFLERVVIREELLVQGAADAKLDQREDVRDRLRDVYRSALIAALRAESRTSSPVTDDDIKAYYASNATKFHAPSRVNVWRIQVGTEKEALDILDELKKDSTPKKWNDLARDRSLDKTSSLRGGNIGFVAPDGSTTEPGIEVGPVVVAAINHAKDGELLPAPVKDADRFDVLWRRQSMKPVDRPIDFESSAIRQLLAHQRTEQRIKGVVEQLRKDHVTETHPEEVDGFDVAASGDLELRRRPGTLPASKRGGSSPAPKAGPGGAR